MWADQSQIFRPNLGLCFERAGRFADEVQESRSGASDRFDLISVTSVWLPQSIKQLREAKLNIAEPGIEVPTLDDLRKKLTALNNEIGSLTGS